MTTIQQRFNKATFNRLKNTIINDKTKTIFKVDPKDPNFDKPLKELFKDYENNT